MSAAKKHKRVVLSLEQKLEVLTWPATVPSLWDRHCLAHKNTPHSETPQQQVSSAAWRHDNTFKLEGRLCKRSLPCYSSMYIIKKSMWAWLKSRWVWLSLIRIFMVLECRPLARVYCIALISNPVRTFTILMMTLGGCYDDRE